MTKKKKLEAFTVEESWPKMTREVRLLTDIHPYPRNARTHPPAQIAMLAGLIKRFGPDQDIVIDGDDDCILKGHGRRLGAIAAGLKEFPCTIRHGMSEADKTAMRIQDNQVALLSGWDPELIRSEIGLLKTMDFDVGLLGFGEAQLVEFMTTPMPPSEFPAVGDDIPTDFCCPKCGYAWSGNPMAGAKGRGKKKPDPKKAKAAKASQ